ncbi:MAG: Crp/Fnr family transcriptional regulator [Spirochaetales bacterium]|nr:Crp/Fnr family transcriptional regulator [Spirochaetales bacterium]
MTRSELVSLSEVPLFRDVDVLALDRFFSSRDIRVHCFEKDQIILNQGDPCNDLPVLLSGEAGAFMAAPSGKMIRIETLKGPCAAASAILFSTEHTFPVSLTAENRVELIRLSTETVLALMQEYPEFLKAYLRENGDKLVFLSEKIRLFQFKSLRQKIAGHILMLAARQGRDDVRMIYSREDLSQLMAVARPSLSREISQLTGEGLIDASGKKVRILNRKALMAILKEE